MLHGCLLPVTNCASEEEVTYNYKFTGFSGPITMNEHSERQQGFSVNRIQDNGRFDKVVDIKVNVTCMDCDIMQYSHVCETITITKYKLFVKVVTELNRNFWATTDGSVPPDEPACGFDGQKC